MGMKLNYKRTFFVGLAFLSICAFWELYDGIVPKMLANTFHLGETATGVVMAMDNVLALFLLPLIGAASDKVDTRIGKRMPFIIGGTILASVFILLMPIAEHSENIVLFITALGLVLISMGLYRSPAVALMPDITPKPLRSKANAVINLMGTLGGAYALAMIKILYTEDGSGNLPVFISVVAIMLLAVGLLFLTIREKKLTAELKEEETAFDEAEVQKSSDASEKTDGTKVHNSSDALKKAKDISREQAAAASGMPKEVRRSFYFIMASIFLWFAAYNAVKTAFSRYAEKVWGFEAGSFADPLLIAIVAALISYIPIGFISSKLGRKKTIISGIVLMTFSYLLGFLVKEYSLVINLIFAVTGIGWAAISVNSYPMVVEMCKGADTGKYTGLYYTFSMAAQTITPIVSGAFMEKISYRTLFPYALFFSIASLCTMLFVKHGDSKPPRKNAVLENFDTED